jgi:hypothetical protein
MKVKELRFRPLGRKPLVGEWFRCDLNSGDIYYVCQGPNAVGEAVERREVEIDVPDPVPEPCAVVVEMVGSVAHDHENGDPCLICADRRKSMDRVYRDHVAERAKAVAAQWKVRGLEAVIREEFLKP